MTHRVVVIGLLAFATALATSLTGAAAESAAPNATKAVIELFTSQGCSSCPPADKLLNKLHDDPSLVTLSLPIDYWDYLGWKDTLADPRNSARQRAYSQARGDREVYTPQIVVNGTAQALGSDEAQIQSAIAESRGHAETLSIPVSVAVKGDSVVVSATASNPAALKAADVWICGVSQTVPIAVTRGENRGKTLTYTNVVRRWIRLGRLNDASSWSLPLNQVKADGVDTLVVLIQDSVDDKPGVMLGAATASLR